MNNNDKQEIRKAIDLISKARDILSEIGSSLEDRAADMPENFTEKIEALEDEGSRINEVAENLLNEQNELEEMV